MGGAEAAMLLLKVSSWCALPFALWPLMVRLSASTRHLLLTLTLAGSVALPLLLAVAPAWQAPAWLRPAPLAPASGAAVEPLAAAAPRPGTVERPAARPGPGEPYLAAVPRSGDGPPAAPAPRPAGSSRSLLPRSAASAEPAAAAARGASRLTWLWLAGVAAVVLGVARRALHAARIVRDATPIEDRRAVAAMARAARRLGLEREPELRQSPRFPVPFAWRGRRSAVVLPAAWRRWDDERLTVVLVHELAHLRRRDAVALWIGRAATALWWFHPLVRWLEGWARRECERAADDAVLLSGSRASDYAEHVLAISRALTRPLPSGVALTMSNSPVLKHRLLAILRPDQPRRVLTRRLAAGTSMLTLALAVVLAGARFAPPAEAQVPEPDVDLEIRVGGSGTTGDGDGWSRGDGDDRGDSDEDSGSDSDSDSWDSEEDSESESDSESDAESDSESDSDSDSWHGHASRFWHGHARDQPSRDWKRAYEAHSRGRYEESIAAFEAMAEAGYRPAVSTYNAACGLSLSGRGDEALAALERALDLGFDSPEMLAEDSDLDPLRADPRFQALVDEAFERAGERRDPIEHHRYRETREALEVLRSEGSEDAGAWSKVGTRLLMQRDLDGAVEALENAVRYAREEPVTALYNLACAHALAGHPGDALDALETAIEAGYSDADHMTHDPDLRSLRGEAEFDRLVDLADALDLDRFQRHGRHHGHGWGRHGDEHGERRDGRYSAERWAPAIDFYRGFVDEHPDLGAGWFNLGYALHFSERFAEAVEAFARARDLGFRPATATYNVACGYSMLERVDEAMAALEEAIELGFRGGDLTGDPDLDNLRGDPRFRTLRLKMRLDRRG